MIDPLIHLAASIAAGDCDVAVVLTRSALDRGISGREIVQSAVMPAMEKVGSDFSSGNAFLPELIAAGHAMSCVVEAMRASEPEQPASAGTVVLGTVKGDIHDIGKNLVKMSLEGAGMRVIDLGVDVDVSAFVQAARESRADIVGLSALLSASLTHMEATMHAIRTNLTCKVLVGGAPVTDQYARRIGADGYAPDAYLAARTALDII